jgi:hypothetical protein
MSKNTNNTPISNESCEYSPALDEKFKKNKITEGILREKLTQMK